MRGFSSRSLGALCAGLLCTGVVVAQSGPPAEVYSFNTIGVAAGDDSYVDMFAGDDLLPYTDDDVALPERGNSGGTWGFAHHDLDSDGAVGAEEPIFAVIRRGDDDTFGFSANTHPEYGVIYEAEDWIDYHEARNAGPSATLIGDPDAEGNDFEHNDRSPWESESNAYMFNNLQANQHGKGKSRYYFENINPSAARAADEPFIYDEIEGFEKPLNFQHNMDDPTTADFDERGGCRRDYFRTFDAITRGYLIPVDDLDSLEDGSLQTLFGWETVDLAAYLRDVIAPKVDGDDVQLFHPAIGQNSLGVTHLMLMQIEAPIEVNVGETCGDGMDQALAQASYWGIPETGATYRVSHLLGYNDQITFDLFGEDVRSWTHEADDGEARNLWLLDHFFRDEPTHLGKYEIIPTEATYTITDDLGFRSFDGTSNKILLTESGGMVTASLPRPLEESELPVEFVVDFGETNPEAGTSFQIALFSNEEVALYAEVSPDASAVRFGGEVGSLGWVDDGEGGGDGGSRVGTEAEFGEYARYVLRISGERVSLLEVAPDEYFPNDFTGLNERDLDELVGVDISAQGCGAFAGIDAIGVSLDGPGAFSTLALLAAPPGSTPCGSTQRPMDCNQDGNVDLSDGICVLGHLFLGSPTTLPCGDGTVNDAGNLALLDSTQDGAINLSDAVSLFQFLFVGGQRPGNCVDPDEGSCAECAPMVGCPAVDACP